MPRRVNWLRPLAGRTPKQDAFLALRGASYHLAQVIEQFNKGLTTDDQISLFHWHLRSFFWELAAVRDTLQRAARADPAIAAALAVLHESDWFIEVLAYRNFAHQSFQVVEALVPRASGKVIAFQLQVTHDSQEWNPEGPGHLKSYWDKMQRFLLGLYPPG